MPATYTLIASNTLSSSAASVTFSAIPATYTDLIVKVSARGSETGTLSNFNVQINADTGSNYSRTRMYATGTSALSQRTSNDTSFVDAAFYNAAGTTADTFANIELYFPNYTSTANKPFSGTGASENNATTGAAVSAHALLYRNSTAISSIGLLNNAGNFVSGSSFFLYGIKNS